MACWLMSKENPGDSIRNTLTAAYELHTMTDEMNRIYPQLPLPLRIGVGISTGEAMFGDMGSGRLQDYTVLGESVNTAFHLERASKELNTDVIISYNSARRYPHSFWEKFQASVNVKGKDEPLEVFQLKFTELAEVLR
jgi:adenylate cyclase